MNIKGLGKKYKESATPRASKVRGLLYLCVSLSILLSIFSEGRAQTRKQEPSETLTASLITCWPGSEIYELCGHEAIRIKGEGIDSVWNFGLFDFNEPNFVYRFVKGETDYMVAGYPFAWFIPEYSARGSRVEEQVLNLTPEEVARLRRLLQVQSLPPNNRYRYNYIKNNCSTQIADMLDSVAGGKVLYTDTVRFTDYRDAMRSYHRNYPWYQFGIDLALGSGLEEEISPRQELFIPVEFNRHARKAFMPGGKPLVKSTNVLNEGREDAVLPPTPWYAGPVFASAIVLAISLLIIVYSVRTGKVAKWWYALFFGVEGLAGCLIFFLVFFSLHAATSPNLLIYWLNPLQLLIPIFLWVRRGRIIVKSMMWLNICAVGLMIILLPIFNRGQGDQTAFIILMATDIILSIFYLLATRGSSGHSPRRSSGKKSTGRGGKSKKRKTKAKSLSYKGIEVRYNKAR